MINIGKVFCKLKMKRIHFLIWQKTKNILLILGNLHICPEVLDGKYTQKYDIWSYMNYPLCWANGIFSFDEDTDYLYDVL